MTSRPSLCLWLTVALGLPVLAASTAARADDRGMERAELGVGAQAGVGLGDVCDRDGDVVACGGGLPFAGVQAALHYRLSERWSLGGGGFMAWGNASPGLLDASLTWWLLEAQARFHPLGAGTVDPSLGLGGGVVVIDTALPASASAPRRSSTYAAPALSLRLAVDIQLARGFLLGPELRGFLLMFSGDPESASNGSERYGMQPGVALAINASFRFASER